MDRFFRRLLHAVGDLSDLLDFLVKAPFRRFRSSGEGSVWLRILLLPFTLAGALIGLVGKAVLLPVQFVRNAARASWTQLLSSVPVLIVIGLLGFVLFRNVNQRAEIAQRYRTGAVRAMGNEKYEDAVVYLTRLINDFPGPDKRDALLDLSIAYGRLGKSEQALAILKRLAPEEVRGRSGYPKAHELMAINLAAELNAENAAQILDRLYWHLDQAPSAARNPGNARLQKSWAQYYVFLGESNKAVKYLERVAPTEPKLYFVLHDIAKKDSAINSDAVASKALERAEAAFRDLSERSPTTSFYHIQLAKSLFMQNRFAEAESQLLNAQKINNTPEIRTALADYFTTAFDRIAPEAGNFGQRWEILNTALSYDLSHLPAYQRLLTLYEETRTESDREQIAAKLKETITNPSGSTAAAHFALSNIYWQQGNQAAASRHIEQAFAANSQLAVIGNNLAWMLAHAENPDLDRAKSLAQAVVEQAPKDPRFMDTLGTVLLKRKETKQAIALFEDALSGMNEKIPIHEKLIEAYEKLGDEEMAELHRQQIQKLTEDK